MSNDLQKIIFSINKHNQGPDKVTALLSSFQISVTLLICNPVVAISCLINALILIFYIDNTDMRIHYL